MRDDEAPPMLDSVEIPVTTRITLPEVWSEFDATGKRFAKAKGLSEPSKWFMEEIPAEKGGLDAMLGRLRDFLTRNAKVELLQG